jgi:SAM-dependent methyltransferase
MGYFFGPSDTQSAVRAHHIAHVRPGAQSQRERRPELMDQPGLDPGEHARALRGLGRINRASRSDAILWPWIARVAEESRQGPVRVLDLACGGGDVAIALARRAAASGLDVRIEGCDLSAVAVEFAARAAQRAGVPVRFAVLDALSDPIPDGCDVVACSLFLHHLALEQAESLLRKMAAAAGRLVLVNDLLRGRLGYALAWTGCRLFSRSAVVHHDGPASVRAAFTMQEMAALARRSGLERAILTRHWPERFLLCWSRGFC